MTPQPHSHPPNQIAPKHTHDGLIQVLYRIGRLMFFAVLFFLFYLLAHSMVEHRFFQGGWVNQNGTIRP